MTRAIWKGEISFGLVSIPVSLVSTEENKDLHFHLLNSKTSARVRYRRIDEKTGKEVPWDNIVKGYEYDKGNYIIVNEEDFVNEEPELFKTINLEEFVDFKEIDSLYYTKPYYLVPEGKNKKSYVLLREALRKTSKVGVAKTILKTKQYVSLILPHYHTLLLYLIHFKDEIRSEEALNIPKAEVKAYKISDKEIKMAMDLINDMSTSWKPEKYHDEYRETLQKWLDQQIQKLTKSGKKVMKIAQGHEEVVDFVSLLKASMQKKKSSQSSKKKASVKNKKG